MNKMQIQIRIQNMVMMKNWKIRKQLQEDLLAYCKLYKDKKYLQGENFYMSKSFAISQMAYSLNLKSAYYKMFTNFEN